MFNLILFNKKQKKEKYYTRLVLEKSKKKIYLYRSQLFQQQLNARQKKQN